MVSRDVRILPLSFTLPLTGTCRGNHWKVSATVLILPNKESMLQPSGWILCASTTGIPGSLSASLSLGWFNRFSCQHLFSFVYLSCKIYGNCLLSNLSLTLWSVFLLSVSVALWSGSHPPPTFPQPRKTHFCGFFFFKCVCVYFNFYCFYLFSLFCCFWFFFFFGDWICFVCFYFYFTLFIFLFYLLFGFFFLLFVCVSMFQGLWQVAVSAFTGL